MAKELFAAEQLVIWVLDPALAQRFVREIECVLEDRQPRHQARRQRRLTRPIAVDRAELLLQKLPVDLPPQPCKGVVHSDDLIEPRLETIVLPAIALVPRPHRESPVSSATRRRESRRFNQRKLQENEGRWPENLQNRLLENGLKSRAVSGLGILHGRLSLTQFERVLPRQPHWCRR